MQVEKLKDCLVKIAIKSGFDNFDDFVKYKETNLCDKQYTPVYPEIQIISTNDDKMNEVKRSLIDFSLKA